MQISILWRSSVELNIRDINSHVANYFACLEAMKSRHL